MGRVSLKRPRSVTRSLFAWIFVGCLFCSLLVHLMILSKSRNWMVPGFAAESYDLIVPRTFKMKRVEIDPKTLAEEKPREKKNKQRPEVVISDEKPTVMTDQSTGKHTPSMERPSITAVLENDQHTPSSLLPNELSKNAGKEEGLTAGLEVPLKNSAPIALPEPLGSNDGVGFGTGRSVGKNEKFSNLEDLLSGTGSVTAQTAPILMPTDLLFEYDSDTLRKEAEHSLSQLGTLIWKNNQASFRIEGHTDSFGSDDYNDQLSLRRAEAVKAWLIQNSGLDPRNITTAGLGKKHLLAPGSGSVAEQQLNRRVEIVITTH